SRHHAKRRVVVRYYALCVKNARAHKHAAGRMGAAVAVERKLRVGDLNRRRATPASQPEAGASIAANNGLSYLNSGFPACEISEYPGVRHVGDDAIVDRYLGSRTDRDPDRPSLAVDR